MAVTKFPPAVLAAVLSACATESVLLNSERIQKRFGSYGIDVLASEAGLRRSNLFSMDGEPRTCRTYAVVRFTDQLDERYREEHAKVLAGNSIGATFKAHGWNVHKQTMHIGTLQLPAMDNSVSELMHLQGPRELAMHVYQLLLIKDEQVFEYAIIMEAHHPDYLASEDLHSLYEYDTTNAMSTPEARELAAVILDSEI